MSDDKKEKEKKDDDYNGMAIGGGLLTGVGVGFSLLQRSPLFFVGCIIAGLGVGLIISSILYNLSNKNK